MSTLVLTPTKVWPLGRKLRIALSDLRRIRTHDEPEPRPDLKLPNARLAGLFAALAGPR